MLELNQQAKLYGVMNFMFTFIHFTKISNLLYPQIGYLLSNLSVKSLSTIRCMFKMSVRNLY